MIEKTDTGGSGRAVLGSSSGHSRNNSGNHNLIKSKARMRRDCCRVRGVHPPLHEQELKMSGRNGDRARFHRDRKKKIARRIRNHAMLKKMGEQGNKAAGFSDSKPKAVAA